MKVSDTLLDRRRCSATRRTRATSAAPAAASSCGSRSGTLYVGYGDGPWYVGATLGAGSLDYSDVNRNIQLGAPFATKAARRAATNTPARLLGGYWFKYQDGLHGPYARVTYTKAIVAQFSENGTDSTALTYGEQERRAVAVEPRLAGRGQRRQRAAVRARHVGIRFAGRRPHGFGVVGHARRQVLDARRSSPTTTTLLFNVGASADFGGVTGFIAGSATAGRSDGNYWAITVGVRVPL